MRRGFEKVSGYEYVNFPKRKTKQSAGYDIESAVNVVINPGDEGHIIMALRNTSGSPCAIKVGDRIAQGIFHRYYKVDNDSADGDRTGGIGSTGK